MDSYNLQPLQHQLEDVFALQVALTKALELHRLKVINKGLLPEKGDTQNLVKKEDLQHLEKHSKMDRTLAGKGSNHAKGYSSYKSKGFSRPSFKGYHPYHSSSSQSSNYGRGGNFGKGKGKGRPQSKFQFKQD